MTTSSAKAALRSDVLRRRSAVDPGLRQRTSQHLASLGPDLVRRFAPERAVAAAYHPVHDEVDPLPLLAALADAGIVTALPVMVARAEPLRFRAWRPGEPLRAASYGVLEPTDGAPELVPDVLFVPLAAFDPSGRRLGYGAGFYDATLRSLRRAKRVLAVGIAYAAQEVERVPDEPHDERLDAVVTEHGFRSFGQS